MNKVKKKIVIFDIIFVQQSEMVENIMQVISQFVCRIIIIFYSKQINAL